MSICGENAENVFTRKVRNVKKIADKMPVDIGQLVTKKQVFLSRQKTFMFGIGSKKANK